MSTTVTYKGTTLTTATNQTKVLETEGTWLEDDITITDVSAAPSLQAKSNIDPTTSSQTIYPDAHYDGLSSVQINAMPSGQAKPPATITGSNATATVDSGNLVLTKNILASPVVTAGYVSMGSAASIATTLSTPATNLEAGNIKNGVTIFGITGTYSGGGSDRLVLLQTTSLGSLSTTSTSAADTGKTVTLASSTNWDDYDLLLVDISVNTVVNGRHTSSVTPVLLTGTSNVNTKNTYTVGSNVWNSKVNSSGTKSTRQSTTKYGVYINAASVSNSTLTLTVYYRYNSNSTSTLNGSYTARVYGIKLIDLIGG